jgi:hypothetical protein
MVAAAHRAEEQGQRAIWRVSHNTYTQISSECGIPGLVFYMIPVVLTFVYLRRARKMTQGDPDMAPLSSAGFCMLIVASGNALQGCFASNAYLPFFPILAGLSESYLRIVQQEIQSRSAVVPSPAPAMPSTVSRQILPAPVPAWPRPALPRLQQSGLGNRLRRAGNQLRPR